jgi:hypothetical protein
MMESHIVLGLLGLPALFAWLDFLKYLFTGETFHKGLTHVIETIIMTFALAVLLFDIGANNDCCGDSATFAPEHRLTVVVLVLLCLAAYFYSSYRKTIAPPIFEIIVNCLLIIGFLLDLAVGAQEILSVTWIFGNGPIALYFLIMLAKNHKKAMESLDEQTAVDENRLVSFCRKLLFLHPLAKMPILLFLCLPVLILLVWVLLLFGQKPDSLIRAFTDTYKHGFSQLDSQCNGVVCGGHFLCTIAANGHKDLVRPIRMGIRADKPIKCNRQLLISNAFEELLEQHLPWLHRPVRNFYNKIGALIHRYHAPLNHAWVSDCIYLLMKPLEWLFLLVLYLFDRHPENRIAQQYLHWDDRLKLKVIRCVTRRPA